MKTEAEPMDRSGKRTHRRACGARGARLWILLALALAGFVVATYLTFAHYRGVSLNCYLVQGCDAVQGSRYATLGGVPVALLGACFFATMFYLGTALVTTTSRKVVLVYQVLAYAGALATIPLFLLQAAVLHAFCFYCLLSEALMLALWLATLGLRPRGQSLQSTPESRAGTMAASAAVAVPGDAVKLG